LTAAAAGVWQLTRYQEQPQLLDPHLASIVGPLAAVLREKAGAEGAPDDTAALVAVSRLLWAVATIRRAQPATPLPPAACLAAGPAPGRRRPELSPL
jgi:hypothetical protein